MARKRKTLRRQGGWCYETIVPALLEGGWSLCAASWQWTEYMKLHRGERRVVRVHKANDRDKVWSRKKWTKFLIDNKLTPTKTESGREALV